MHQRPNVVGLLINGTSDGAMLCSADSSTEITMQPQPLEEEIQYILDGIMGYLTVDVDQWHFLWGHGMS
jgi:hypothetical protein